MQGFLRAVFLFIACPILACGTGLQKKSNYAILSKKAKEVGIENEIFRNDDAG